MNSSITLLEQTTMPGRGGKTSPARKKRPVRRGGWTELAQSEARLRQFVAQVDAGEALYVVDPSGRILAWNAAAEELLGYSAEEMCGQNHAALYTIEGDLTQQPRVALRKAGLAGVHHERGWRRHRDGTRCELDVVTTPLASRQEEPAGYTITMRRVAGLTSPVVLIGSFRELESGLSAAELLLCDALQEHAA